MGTHCCRTNREDREEIDTIEAPEVAALTASVLNRWRCVEISTLQALFRSNSANRKRLLDLDGFTKLFPFIKEYPPTVRQTMFKAFDTSNHGGIDFRDFCWTLALCVHGTPEEMACVLYALFTGSSTASLSLQSTRDAPPSKSAPPERIRELSPPNIMDSTKELSVELSPHAGVAGTDPSNQGSSDQTADVKETNQEAHVTPPNVLSISAIEAMLLFCNMSESNVASAVSQVDAAGINFEQFPVYVQHVLTNEAIALALRKFDLLPSAAQERERVEASISSAASNSRPNVAVAQGDTVYILHSVWWREWCEYVHVAPFYDQTGTFLLNIRPIAGDVSPNHRSRPNEVDNTELQSPSDPLTLKEGLRGGHLNDYILVPQALWDTLLILYGGGPSIARNVSEVRTPGIDSLIDNGYSVVVDLYPLVLNGYWCSPFGRPEPMLAGLIISNQVTVSGLVNWTLRAHKLHLYVTPESVRVWVLRYNLPEDGDTSFERRDSFLPQSGISTTGRPMQLTTPEGDANSPPSSNPVSPTQDSNSVTYTHALPVQATKPKLETVRHGANSWWVLLAEATKNQTLQELTVSSGSSVMFELQNVKREWPTAHCIEKEGFRNFKPEDPVDAMDYQGRWYPGTVVEIVEDPPSVASTPRTKRVKVHFDKFASKWDELYDIRSHKLAPRNTHSAKQENIAPIVINMREPLSSKRTDAQNGTSQDSNNDTPVNSPSKEKPVKNSPNAVVPHSNGNGFRKVKSKTKLSNGHAANGHADADTSKGRDKVEIVGVPFVLDYGEDERHEAEAMPTQPPSKPTVDADHKVPHVPRSRFGGRVRPQMLGACGLMNLGNTCFLNTGLQCLSHTPLFRAYLLSGKYLADVNRQNPLGTQGKLVEEFSLLLRQLWSGESLYIVPTKFKRVIEKVKPQFHGHDQHDAQEFLAEMLDTLHEDVNRVLDKPYVPNPDDATIESMTAREHADDSWRRHVARNRSALVDLFQGQMRSDVTCPTCAKTSRTFDPFMYLSIPVPQQHEKTLTVILVPRMRTYTRNHARFSDIVRNLFQGIMSETKTQDMEEFIDAPKPLRFSITVPKLGDISDIKRKVAKKMGVEKGGELLFTAVEVQSRVIGRLMDDKEPVSPIRESMPIYLYEISKNLTRIMALNSERLNRSDGGFVTRPHVHTDQDQREEKSIRKEQSEAEAKNDPQTEPELPTVCAFDETLGGYYSEDDDDIVLDKTSQGEGDVVSDLPCISKVTSERSTTSYRDKTWPKQISEFQVGMRCDAVDHRGDFFAATVCQVNTKGENKTIRVHFDGYSPKWDETFNEQQINEGRVVPLYSRHKRKLRILELQVVHRRRLTTTADGPLFKEYGNPPENSMELMGTPMVVVCENYRTCEHTWREIVTQAMKFVSADYLAKHNLGRHPPTPSTCAERQLREDEARASHAHNRRMAQYWSSVHEKLPFQIRLLSPLNPLVLPLDDSSTSRENVDDDESVANEQWEGSLFPRDSIRPLSNLHHNRLIMSVDWTDDTAFDQNLDTPLNDSSFVEHQAKLMQGNNAPPGSSVTLQDCLSAFTKEEELEEPSWHCSRCSALRKGSMKVALWRLPDILVIHIKRFNCSARFREKIRTKVVFPLTSLDMRPYLSKELYSNSNAQANGHTREEHFDTLYDLYAVSNHLGGMTGGHYTAFCRCVPCGQDGVEEVAISSRDDTLGKWLHFDDEFVEELPQDRVVSEAAYLLFYRKRRFTPSNIINMTV